MLALTGCRRSEVIEIRWSEIDSAGSAFRLDDTKEGQSVRPIGLPVLEYFDERRSDGAEDISPYAFPGRNDDKAFGSFPRHWEKIFKGTELEDVTAHVLRHRDRKSTRLNSSHSCQSRMPSSDWNKKK